MIFGSAFYRLGGEKFFMSVCVCDMNDNTVNLTCFVIAADKIIWPHSR